MSSSEEIPVTSSPPCRLLVRSKEGLEIFTVPERNSNVVETAAPSSKARNFLLKGSTTLQETVPDGSAVYVHVVGKGVVKIALDNNNTEQQQEEVSKPFLENTEKVQMLHQSPSGAFLLTWERWYEDACPNNLKIWQASTGKLLAAFPQKNLKRYAWPYLHWTPDEQYAFLLAGSEVRVFPVANVLQDGETRYTSKLRIPGISALSLPQTSSGPSCAGGGGYYFTSFCPGTKDKPARASLHVYTPTLSSPLPNPYPAVLSKSLFQAEEMKTHWSPLNNAALITLQTSVDASGQSYYGSSQLFLMNATSTDVTAVPLPGSDGGPVADVAWMPNPDKPPCFVTVAGRMPSMACLHHGMTGAPLFQFGHAHRNTIDWAPHGRFVLLAGFGNLAGGMGFWDRNKLKLIPACAENGNGTLRAEAVVGHGWSPDSRLFAVSTCTPRMNVDNGVRVFTYGGVELNNTTTTPWDNAWYQPDKLLQASFVPALRTQYPDRPQTPPSVGGAEAAAAATTTAASATTAAAASKRYVPPSARNRPGGTSLADRLRREKEGNLQGASKIAPGSRKAAVPVVGRTVVGMAPPTTTTTTNTGKSKSALRREKLKAKKQQQQLAETTVAAAVAAAPVAAVPADPEKRARKLKKMLKQIEELKERDAGSLNEDQKKKIATEEDIRKELAELGI